MDTNAWDTYCLPIFYSHLHQFGIKPERLLDYNNNDFGFRAAGFARHRRGQPLVNNDPIWPVMPGITSRYNHLCRSPIHYYYTSRFTLCHN